MRWMTFMIVMGFSASMAPAAVTVTAEQVGGDVVFTGGGTLNVDALSQISAESWQGYIDPAAGSVLVGALPASNAETFEFYSPGIAGPLGFGSGPDAIGDSGVGPRFGITDIAGLGYTVIVPDGYTSGSALDGSLIFSDTNYESLGLSVGTYVWTWGSGGDADSFTLNVLAPIPEPASAAMLAIGGLALLRRRRLV